MYCNICKKKKATVHLTEIVDSQMTELHLCEECAKEKSTQMEQQFGLADLLAGLADFGKTVKEPGTLKKQCPSCGTTYDEFKKLGRLGCSDCYETFRTYLAPLLKKIHGSSRHAGKKPVAVVSEGEQKPDTLQSMRARLHEAIEAEDFEQAALLRDKIRALEKESEA